MYKIEKNVPIQKSTKNVKGSKYPFKDMEVGDSFFVAVAPAKTVSMQCSLTGLASKFFGKNRHVTVRRVNGGLRVWRIK